MITSKQRAYLRSLANTLPAIVQIGKEGLTDSVINLIDEALTARELVKIHLLESSGLTPRETGEELSERLNCEAVQSIGSKLTVYRGNRELKEHIELPDSRKK